MRRLVVLLVALALLAGCGSSDGDSDDGQPSAASPVANQTVAVSSAVIEFEVVENAVVAPGESMVRVIARGIQEPGIRAYELMINFDEDAVEVLEVTDVAFANEALQPICVQLPQTDVNEDGDLMTNIACGLPQPGESGPSGDVELAVLKLKAKVTGDTALEVTRAQAALPDLARIFLFEIPEPFVVNLTVS